MDDGTNFVVYKHTSPNGKVYIGITMQTPSKRFGSNGNHYRDNEHFWRAIKRYGWNNFKHEILYSGLSKETACIIEIELIKKYKSDKREYGYNIAPGGEHPEHSEKTRRKIGEANKGKVISDEQRKKISEANKLRVYSEETRRKMSEAMKGHIVSEETRKKLSEANKGRVVSEETRKKISEVQKGKMKGHIVSEETRRKISKANKGRVVSKETRKKLSEANKGSVLSEETRKKIGEALKGRVNSEETRKKKSEANKGRVASEETREKMSKNARKTPVMCVETGIVYESAKNAEQQTGINQGSISNVCNGKRKTASGLHWNFVKENDLQ